jgi:hypothetical protein
MCCVVIIFLSLSTFYRKGWMQKIPRGTLTTNPQQPALRALHRDKNNYYYYYSSISQWLSGCCVFITWLGYRHICVSQSWAWYLLLMMKILVPLWVWSIVMVYLVNEYSKQNAFFIHKAWRGIDKV